MIKGENTMKIISKAKQWLCNWIDSKNKTKNWIENWVKNKSK